MEFLLATYNLNRFLHGSMETEQSDLLSSTKNLFTVLRIIVLGQSGLGRDWLIIQLKCLSIEFFLWSYEAIQMYKANIVSN